MAGTPKLKVYSPSNEYVASCKHAEDAILVAGSYGNDAEVRWDHSKNLVVWRVSADDDLTGDGESMVDAELVWQRVEAINSQWEYVGDRRQKVRPYTYKPRERKESD